MKSQGDSSFPADGHKAILNKMNNKSKTNRKRTNIDNRINHNRSTAPEWSVINFWWGKTLTGFMRAQPRRGFCCGVYKLFGPHEGHLTHQWIKTAKILKSRFITEMKQDEYSTVRPSLKRWSKRNPAVGFPNINSYAKFVENPSKMLKLESGNEALTDGRTDGRTVGQILERYNIICCHFFVWWGIINTGHVDPVSWQPILYLSTKPNLISVVLLLNDPKIKFGKNPKAPPT